MKTSSRLFCLLLLLSSSVAFAEAITPTPAATAISRKHQNLLTFKVGRKFRGALIEVFYSNGDLVAAKLLVKRKMVINFCYVKSGAYTIKVIKNNRVEEFTYLRK